VHPRVDDHHVVDRDPVDRAGDAVRASIAELADRVLERRALVPSERRLLVGVAGSPGAGKTTLAQGLVDRLSALGWHAAHVPMDGFHLADIALAELGRSGRKGAPDTFDPGGYAALLARLAAGEEVWAPAFERELEQPLAQAIHVPPAASIVVSEGNYLLLDEPQWRAVHHRFDEVWFCALDDELRRERLVARHIAFGKDPASAREWVRRVDEANARLVEASATRAGLRVTLD
jgi:pantothenate kinase